MLIFFFSSRRRHTRYWRDWSSDVCSSDLGPSFHRTQLHSLISGIPVIEVACKENGFVLPVIRRQRFDQKTDLVLCPCPGKRSEERRVGKECRSRWSPYH